MYFDGSNFLFSYCTQIPKQLFKKPHPAKKVQQVGVPSTPLTPMLPVSGLNSLLAAAAHIDRIFIHNIDALRPSVHPVKQLRGAVGQMIQQEKNLLAVEQNKVLIPVSLHCSIPSRRANTQISFSLFSLANVYAIPCLGLS